MKKWTGGQSMVSGSTELILQQYRDECRLVTCAVNELLNRLARLRAAQANSPGGSVTPAALEPLENTMLRLAEAALQLARRTSRDLDALGLAKATKERAMAATCDLLTVLRRIVLVLGDWKSGLPAEPEVVQTKPAGARPPFGPGDSFLARN